MENKKLDEKCIMPNYEEMRAKAECEAEYWRTQNGELMDEVIYLRGVKHTVEAFLGKKIGEENGKS